MLHDLFVLKKIKEGDIDTFEKLFRKYYTPLCLYATTITNRMDISEEIIQDLFYVLWKDRLQLKIVISIKSYMYRSVRNRALQYCEHRQVQDKHKEYELRKNVYAYDKDENPEGKLEYKELELLIENTLDAMPERRRNIFRMHRLEKKKYSEIAEIFSISVKTVEAEITKALHALRDSIDRYDKILL